MLKSSTSNEDFPLKLGLLGDTQQAFELDAAKANPGEKREAPAIVRRGSYKEPFLAKDVNMWEKLLGFDCNSLLNIFRKPHFAPPICLPENKKRIVYSVAGYN